MTDASNWPGGVVHESMDAWIDRQSWTSVGKARAREIVAACDAKRLNYPQVAQWRKWAEAGGWYGEPQNDEGCTPGGWAKSPT